MSSNFSNQMPTSLTAEGVVLNAPDTYQGAIEHTIVFYHQKMQICGKIFDKAAVQSLKPVDMTLEEKRRKFQWAPLDAYPPHLQDLGEAALSSPFDPAALGEAHVMLAQDVPADIQALAPNPVENTTMKHLELRNKALRTLNGGKKNMYLHPNIGDRTDWYTDAVFAQQQFTGVNPTTITLASEAWIAVFNKAATEKPHVQTLLSSRATNGSLFVQDYSYFRSAVGASEDAEMKSVDGEKYTCASVALFNLEDSGALHPLAIIIDWKGSLANSVVIFNRGLDSQDRQDEENDWPWRFAKTCVNSADWTRHEIGIHLVNTHLVEEAIIVSAHRTLPPEHPVFRLLSPHWSVTLSVNFAARSTLVPGVILKLAGCSPQHLFAILNHAYQTFDFTGQYVPNDLKTRGFPINSLDEPKYHNYGYARNIVRTWETLRKFVSGVLTGHYPGGDKQVVDDDHVKNFSAEMRSPTGAQLKSFPVIKTLDELIDMVTMCIHIASAQHSAVNYLQEYYQVFIPNKPSAIYAPLPKTAQELSRYTEASLIDALPVDFYRDWLISAQLPYLLSSQVAADGNILQYAESELKNADPYIKDAAIVFKQDLVKLQSTLKDISLQLDDQTKPYNVLDPELTASSIVI